MYCIRNLFISKIFEFLTPKIFMFPKCYVKKILKTIIKIPRIKIFSYQYTTKIQLQIKKKYF